MDLLHKARQLVQRFGAPTKFAAKLVVDAVLPGPIGGLVGKVLDCALDAAKDNLNSIANDADLARIERMFELLSNEFQGVMTKLSPLENVPDQARQTLRVALATEDQSRKAAQELKALGLELAVMKDVLLQLAGGQRELVGLARKMYEMQFDYIEEEKAAGVDPRRMAERLDRIEAGMAEMLRGQRDIAESIFARLSREEPRSGALALALGTAQQSNRNYLAAQKTLLRAHRLRPGDVQLEQLSRIATELSRPADTPTGQEPAKRVRPVPGKTLDGWLLEVGYGHGGFGQIFRATKNGQVRALKILHPELADDPYLQSRFKREIAMLAALDPHPNLVRIDPDHCFGWATEWTCWYYVMDLVEGTSLQAHLESGGALTFDQVHHYFTGIIEGLAGVHTRGLHHRDIKPANILVRAQTEESKGRFVLADFGLAGGVDSTSRGLGHTPGFAAPEQYRIGVADARSDVYSLAATIHYSLLFGDSAKRSLYKAKHLPETVPGDYRALLDRCLDTDPSERPADAREFLKHWLEIGNQERRAEQQQRERQQEETNRLWQRLSSQAGEPTLDAAAPTWKRRSTARLPTAGQELKRRSEPERQPQIIVPKIKPCMLDCTGADGAEAAQVQKAQQDWADYLGVPVAQALDLGGNVKLEMLLIPPGKFMMGSPDVEDQREDTEVLHEVELTQPFYLGKFPVTQQQYVHVLQATNPSYFCAHGQGKDSVRGLNTRQFPVEQVSGADAETFCRVIGGKCRIGTFTAFQLPTEAQWEYACRAGTRTPFHVGDELSTAQANIHHSMRRSSEVGAFATWANAFGLFDMHGNVWEWCADCWGKNDKSAKRDPVCSDGAERVKRGGCWISTVGECRSAYRGGLSPSRLDASTEGFRLALVICGS